MVYVDTSARIRRYITETRSDVFDASCMVRTLLAISRLTLVEMRCVLAHRRRNNEITALPEEQEMDEVRTDIQNGALIVHPFNDDQAVYALHLINQVAPPPLRTQDALHRSAAIRIDARTFATAGKNQAAAAQALGMTIFTFN